MRISDWSSDVCSSDLLSNEDEAEVVNIGGKKSLKTRNAVRMVPLHPVVLELGFLDYVRGLKSRHLFPDLNHRSNQGPTGKFSSYWGPFTRSLGVTSERKSFHSFRHCYRNKEDMMPELVRRSEEHTSELQSLMRRS